MRIPDSFKAAQAAAFQDKTIAHHAAVTSTAGALGGKTVGPAETPTATFQVNVQVISDALTAQEYGLQLGRDIRITSSTVLPIPKGHFIAWDGQMYRVVGAPQHDSHQVLLGELVGP